MWWAEIPTPPSTNNLFSNASGSRGRVRTDAYKKWITAAGWELHRQHLVPVTGNVRITLYLPAKTRGDIDNRCKAALDLLVEHGLIEDDSKVQHLTIIRGWGPVCKIGVGGEP